MFIQVEACKSFQSICSPCGPGSPRPPELSPHFYSPRGRYVPQGSPGPTWQSTGVEVPRGAEPQTGGPFLVVLTGFQDLRFRSGEGACLHWPPASSFPASPNTLGNM